MPQDYWGDPTDNAHKIAQALGISVDALFGSDGCKVVA